MSWPGAFVWARVVHVLALAHWLGGAAFVGMVLIPSCRREGGEGGWARFAAAERAFASQARWSVGLTGLAGFWMVFALEAWPRFAVPSYWWMTAMVAVWALYALLLYLVEPLAADRIGARAAVDPDGVLASVDRLHRWLLAAAAVTAAGAVAGSHGWRF